MKLFAKFMAGALVLGLWSCSSDEPVPTPNPDSEGDVFAQLTLQLPEGTRSATVDPDKSTNGNETGKDYENNVDELYVILATGEGAGDAMTYKYLTSANSSAIQDASQKAPTFSLQFQSQDLETYAKDITAGNTGTVYVFAFCNPTADLKTAITGLAAGTDLSTATALEAALEDADKDNLPWAQANRFTMTNALIASAQIPDFQTLIQTHNTKAKALSLGTVKVERVVSRFDFQEKPVDAITGEKNTYIIKDNVSGLSMAYVQVDGMALFNEAKSFYYLPRVSANENWTNPVLCGQELINNWMISPNGAAKFAFAANPEDYSTIADNYYYNFNTLPQALNYSWITNTEDENDWTGAAGTNYYIWRYATENTMPTNAMKNGITTGVCFRAEIHALSDEQLNNITEDPNVAPADNIHPAVALRTAMASGKAIYAYTTNSAQPENNVMLGTAKDVWKYAYTHASSDIRAKFIAAFEAGAFTVTRNGVAVTAAADLFPAPAADLSFETIVATTEVEGVTANGAANKLNENNFTVYTPTKDEAGNNHYYVYYRYYNRHNDNGNPATMGAMEFATVRNNIYKLKVNTIAGFGLPGDLPTPPDTNDETPEVYFKVSVQVLDWVVRVNGIDF